MGKKFLEKRIIVCAKLGFRKRHVNETIVYAKFYSLIRVVLVKIYINFKCILYKIYRKTPLASNQSGIVIKYLML